MSGYIPAGPGQHAGVISVPTGPSNRQSSSSLSSVPGSTIPSGPAALNGSNNAQISAGTSGSFLTESSLRPPTFDEQLRTMYVGGIPTELDDFWLQKLLSAAGPLTGMVRPKNRRGRPREFAFAEYASPLAVSRAAEALASVEIPMAVIEEGEELEDEEAAEKKPSALTIAYSENTANIVSAASGDDDDTADANGLSDSANGKETLAAAVSKVVTTWLDPEERAKAEPKEDADDLEQPEKQGPADDDLADLPPEQREIVAREITAFRERANQREQERLKHEQELLAGSSGTTESHLSISASITTSLPKTTLTNIAPMRTMLPTITASTADLSDDEEAEERRREKEEDELEDQFIERERRFLRDERVRIAAAERDDDRERDEHVRYRRERDAQLRRLADFDDDEEREHATEEYYRDHSSWLRHRTAFRTREREADEREASREREERHSVELSVSSARESTPSRVASAIDVSVSNPAALADSFLGSLANEQPKELHKEGPVRISLKTDSAPKTRLVIPKKTDAGHARLDSLLGDEDEGTTKRRKLIPLPRD
ncbi:hypothetical protein V1511DRAFT_421408 [Dipodascopsis uninucleata]